MKKYKNFCRFLIKFILKTAIYYLNLKILISFNKKAVQNRTAFLLILKSFLILHDKFAYNCFKVKNKRG